MDEIYYRILRVNDRELAVCTMQWFDEHDYDQSKFISTAKYDDLDEAERAAKDYALTQLWKTADALLHIGHPVYAESLRNAVEMARRWIDAG